ncbi:hypothetical protein [Asticcacaulis sp. YBE204]|uniref:hypothetical protein n=1 Tax=Asticcacaulis sp. YBE204 TaxID=1282363 RepID=UPI0003C40AA2|nr:hypothetical protein [Asticcacaulis sp. YBE204]ESQ77482.1 hypothetical protein AEYBE204_17230 [Asticcacaulis sp. YBE204]
MRYFSISLLLSFVAVTVHTPVQAMTADEARTTLRKISGIEWACDGYQSNIAQSSRVIMDFDIDFAGKVTGKLTGFAALYNREYRVVARLDGKVHANDGQANIRIDKYTIETADALPANASWGTWATFDLTVKTEAGKLVMTGVEHGQHGEVHYTCKPYGT